MPRISDRHQADPERSSSRPTEGTAVFGLFFPPALLVLLCITLPCLSACGGPPAEDKAPALTTLRALTGRHARVVWIQDLGDNTDVTAGGSRLRLMGYDSDDDRGERVILSGPANFFRPLITPSGEQIIFSDFAGRRIEVVDWSGNNRRFLAFGRALAVHRDPVTGRVWVYAGRGDIKGRPGPGSRKLYRFDLHSPRQEELLWNSGEFGDAVHVSGNGRWISLEVSRAGCGLIDLESGRLKRFDRGCWPAVAPDDSLRSWCFESSHRAFTLTDPAVHEKRKISLTTAPGIDGHEVYHPRWSNYPRFFILSGPYIIRRGGNSIRGGGSGVEIFAGRFAPNYTTVDAWFQVSRNGRADFFPDLWISGKGKRNQR